MPKSDFIDRRKYKRFDFEQAVKVEIKGGIDLENSEAMKLSLSRNVSMEGVGFCVDSFIPPGTAVELDISLDSSEPSVHLCGKVAWSTPLSSRDGKATCDTGVKLYCRGTPDERRFVAYIYERTINDSR